MTRRRSLFLVLFALFALRADYPAEGSGTVARYRQSTSGAMPARVVIRCAGWAEDSAAHLKLKDFSEERAVYVCRTFGY